MPICKNKKAFTLIELLVVIAIIRILATLAVVSLQNARKNARDAKRMADVKQIQTVLELYFNDNGLYPDSIGSSIATGGVTYMASYPKAPTPPDGDCDSSGNNYTYSQQNSGASYTIDFCIGEKTGGIMQGNISATPGGMINTGMSSSWVCGDNFIDTRDSNEYKTVQIGTQCWFAENLAYLPVVHDNYGFNITGSNFEPAYGVYDYDGDDVAQAKTLHNYNNYGVLYNWYATMNGSITEGDQGACPSGWHIPTDGEFTILIRYLSGDPYCDPGSGCPDAGYRVTDSCYECDNSSGFTALLAGLRDQGGSFSNIDTNAYFWTSTQPHLYFVKLENSFFYQYQEDS